MFLCVLKYLDVCVDICHMILEQKLEETCELLQRATEAEISLRNKCACLEEKQMQKKEQIEVAPSFIIQISNTEKNILSVKQTAQSYIHFSVLFCLLLSH